jgi:hypothetical protein
VIYPYFANRIRNRCEKLELEPFGDKHKLQMLQNAVGDVAAFLYVKHLGDKDIARGLPPL